jgi:hypothetical protein
VAGRAVALVKRVSGSEAVRWLHHDHLGSLEVMTDSNGARSVNGRATTPGASAAISSPG